MRYSCRQVVPIFSTIAVDHPVKNKGPPEDCPLVPAAAVCRLPRRQLLDSKNMKSKKIRRITSDGMKNALGILANLVKLLYEIYKIVAHR